MDETRKADEIRRLLEVVEASEKPWDWEYGLEQARLDIHYLLAALDAAEQRAAEAEALLAECKIKLRGLLNPEDEWFYTEFWSDDDAPCPFCITARKQGHAEN